MMERKVHGFELPLVSVSASCGPVDEAMVSCHAGVVVPRPRFPVVELKRNGDFPAAPKRTVEDA